MIRFLINFFLYGLLFFFIYKFFPDAFSTLVVWVGKVYDVLAEVVRSFIDWVGGHTQSVPPPK